jgi:hypothetical protein
MAITYKIVPIPQYVTDVETYLNAISGSWQLVNIYNSQAYLMSGSALGSVIITGSFTLPSGTVSSSAQVVKLIPANTVSSSVQVDFTLTSNNAGVVSSSAQFKTITNPFTGSFTGSLTGTYTGTLPYTSITSVPTLWSSSAQLPAGTVSGSGQVSYTGLTNIPGNIVSSSAQFTSLTGPFTGSFTGSFVGTHTGTTLGTASYASVSPGGGILSVTSITTSYTASATDQVILMSASSANQIVNLPTAVNNAGKRYWVKNISTAQPFSITPTGTQKIDTAISTSVLILGSGSGSAYSIVSDGANWWQLSQH